jgi:hypothetical protein
MSNDHAFGPRITMMIVEKRRCVPNRDCGLAAVYLRTAQHHRERFAMRLLDIQRRTDGLQPFAILMAELGWAAVRVRDLTRGGYREHNASAVQ